MNTGAGGFTVFGRLNSDGSWVKIDPLPPDVVKTQRRFLFWTWESVEKRRIFHSRSEAVEIAKTKMDDPKYQDIWIEELYYEGPDCEGEYWEETRIVWKNGKWV